MNANRTVRSAVLPLLAVSVSALLVAACSKPPVPNEDVRPVRTLTATQRPTTAAAELPGDVRPRVESRVGFQVAGRITGRRVEVGQAVKAGQTLAILDASDYQLNAAASRAQLSAAQIDRDQQRTDYKRFDDLHRQGFISGADLERRKAALDAAEARYAQAAAQANWSGNQAAYSVLQAPTAGVITAIDAEVGQVVAAGQPVVRIAQTAEKEVEVAIPENRLDALRRIADVRVRLWAGGPELRGRVREIAPIADAATRTYPARITLLDAPGSVALGMTATVVFEAPLAQPTIALPLQALLKEGDATYVWLVDPQQKTVRRSEIKVTAVANNDVVIENGVKSGDVIVTAGVHLLKEGQKVRLLEEPAAAAAAQSGVVPAIAPARTPLDRDTLGDKLVKTGTQG